MILNVHLEKYLEYSRIFLESSIQTYTEYIFVHMVLDRACYHVGSREPVVGFFFHAVCIEADLSGLCCDAFLPGQPFCGGRCLAICRSVGLGPAVFSVFSQ